MELIIRWVIVSLVILAAAFIFSGIVVESFFVAIVTAIVLGFINSVIRPILLILTFPITIVTLGLFTFVINAFLVMLVAYLVPGFEVSSFWWALLLSLILSILNPAIERQSKHF